MLFSKSLFRIPNFSALKGCSMYNVLFVCSQNICRSPYCEYLFRRMVEETPELKGKVEVNSSAVMTPWDKMDPKTREALLREGFDADYLDAHKPGYIWRKYDRKLFREADVIICMTKSHYMWVPHCWQKKMVTLSEAAEGVYKPVPDPWLIKDIEKYIGEMNIIKGYLEEYRDRLVEELK